MISCHDNRAQYEIKHCPQVHIIVTINLLNFTEFVTYVMLSHMICGGLFTPRGYNTSFHESFPSSKMSRSFHTHMLSCCLPYMSSNKSQTAMQLRKRFFVTMMLYKFVPRLQTPPIQANILTKTQTISCRLALFEHADNVDDLDLDTSNSG